MYEYCYHEWREIIDTNGNQIATTCNRCGVWEPKENEDELWYDDEFFAYLSFT